MSFSTDDLAALRSRIADAAEYLKSRPNRSDELGAVLYTGNPHDSIPRKLILDPILNSSEIHTWQLYRLEIGNSAIAAAPNPETLQKLLKVSHMTVYRNLSVLRALRWITLCIENTRDDSGSFAGAVYMVHEEPLGLSETMEIDTSYIQFLEKRDTSGFLKRLNEIKEPVLEHVNHQIITSGEAFKPKSRLGLIVDRIKKGVDDPLDTSLACPPDAVNHTGTDDLYAESKRLIMTVRNRQSSSAKKRGGREESQRKDFSSVNRRKDFSSASNTSITSNTSNYINTCITGNTVNPRPDLVIPKILSLSQKAREWTIDIISQLPSDEQQPMLNYTADCYENRKGTKDEIRSPISWLESCVRKRLAGEFIDYSDSSSRHGITDSTKNNIHRVERDHLELTNLLSQIKSQKRLLKADVDPETRAVLEDELQALEAKLSSMDERDESRVI